MEVLAGIVEKRGWGKRRIGVEMDNYYFSAKAFAVLQERLPNAAFHDATYLVNWQRAVKSPQELAYMETAARIVERMHARSEEHTSKLQSLMRISYAVFCLKKKNKLKTNYTKTTQQISRCTTKH